MDKDTLYKLFDHSATDEERAAVRRWVEESDDNRDEYMAERRVWDLSAIIGEEVAAPAADDGPRRRPWVKWAGRAAAAVALAVVAIGADRMVNPRLADAELPMQTLSVPAGQRLNILLADGTDVWLNSNSTITMPGAFLGDTRDVEIDGEAYFTVAKDATHPFRVHTSQGTIEVTGTEFNVDNYRADDDFSVLLVEGSVNFAGADTTLALAPGNRLSLGADGRFSCTGADAERPDWVRGIVSFRNMPFGDIMARFEKYYGVEVRFSRQDIAMESFSGKFYLEDGIEHALNALRHDVDFEFETDMDNRTITIR